MNRKALPIRILSLVVLAFLAPALAAQQWDFEHDRFDVDSAHSIVGFSIGFMGLTKVEGRFMRYSGVIFYDEKDITRSAVSVSILTDSIDTGTEFRDNHLKTPDFFDAKKYPRIIFRSTKVEKKGDALLLTGDLTLHGVTRQVTIPAQQLHGRMKDMWENTRVGFLGKLTIDRRDFGIVGPASWDHALDAGRLTIGNEVEITLSIQGRISNFDRINLPPKHVASAMWGTFREKGIEAAVAQYRELKETKSADYDWGEGGLNLLGYKLLYTHHVKEALEIFKLNAEAFPESANVYDSLGDGYAFDGQKELSVQNYKKSLEMNSLNINATEMLRQLGAK